MLALGCVFVDDLQITRRCIRYRTPAADPRCAGKALPFAPLIPNAVTIKAMKEARKGGLPQFDSVQDCLYGRYGTACRIGTTTMR